MIAAVQTVLEQAMQLHPENAAKWRGGGSGGGLASGLTNADRMKRRGSSSGVSA